jgi:ParB-like chromosome segregation protein Spo0J
MGKALSRAFRWRKMLDARVHATLEDLARAKGVAPSYGSRVLRLTLLAPEIVEAILRGAAVGGHAAGGVTGVPGGVEETKTDDLMK